MAEASWQCRGCGATNQGFASLRCAACGTALGALPPAAIPRDSGRQYGIAAVAVVAAVCSAVLMLVIVSGRGGEASQPRDISPGGPLASAAASLFPLPADPVGPASP